MPHRRDTEEDEITERIFSSFLVLLCVSVVRHFLKLIHLLLSQLFYYALSQPRGFDAAKKATFH